MNAIVLAGQGIMDVSVEHLGSIEAIFEIAAANGDRSITDDLLSAEVLVMDDELLDKKVVDYLTRKSLHPANATLTLSGEGLEFWELEIDFVIS